MTGAAPGRCLIAGCGDVGNRLGALLAGRGWTAFGLRRRAELVAAPVVPVAADLADPRSLAGAVPRQIDALVFMAAPMVRTLETYRSTYLDGPAHLLNVLGAEVQRLRRVVVVSSTSVYGDADGHWVDEQTAPSPLAFNGQIVLDSERFWKSRGLPLTVIRMAGLYGPDRLWMVRRVQEQGASCQEDPPLWTNRIHVEDAARMIAHVLTLSEPDALYVGVDDEPATECSVMRWLAARLGLPAPPGTGERGRHGKLGNKRLSNRRIRASGFEFLYPSFREGYAEVLANLGHATTGQGSR